MDEEEPERKEYKRLLRDKKHSFTNKKTEVLGKYVNDPQLF